MKQIVQQTSLFVVSLGVLALAACGGTRVNPVDDGGSYSEAIGGGLGTSLAGLDSANTQLFAEGLISFSKVEDSGDGLGPLFNDTGCANCHSAGAIGGAGENQASIEIRVGGIVHGQYSDLEAWGGPIIQKRSIQEFDSSVPFGPEVIPSQATFVSLRLTTPVFGLGLIEAISDQEILARSNVDQGLGIRGVANVVLNPITGETEIGRFGWKSQISNLDVFAADAYLNEMGITNDIFSDESLPQGQPFPTGFDTGIQPNDTDQDVPFLAAFMRFLSPPSSNVVILESKGGQLFESVGCNRCHVPLLQTSSNAPDGLANKNVRLFSDLLLHRMGNRLADGIQQGQAKGDQFRTAPLWGVSMRPLLMHDGRSTTVEGAIMEHGGEASQVVDQFSRLSPSNRAILLQFVESL
ncbi:MAG: di-heme oxidoredictase family protein [Fimbriimonadaceae bacterium]